ncbi:MAG: hypothetical protein ACRDYX_20430 [Egibacteraceae bacterium]
MTAAELRQAIEGPAARAGLVLESGLVETVLVDLGEEPGSLPLLSHSRVTTRLRSPVTPARSMGWRSVRTAG